MNLTSIPTKIVIAALAILAILSVRSTYQKSNELDKFIQDYNSFQKNAKVTVLFADSIKHDIDSLQTNVAIKESAIDRLNVKIKTQADAKSKLAAELDSIEHSLDSVKTIQDTVKVKDAQIINLKSQISTRDTLIQQKDSVISIKSEQIRLLSLSTKMALRRGDSLQVILTNLPKTPNNPDKFWGISMPSRKTIGIIGFISGVVVSNSIHK